MVNYTAAEQLALEKFRASSLADLTHFSGYAFEGDSALAVDFLGQRYGLEYPGGNFKSMAGSDDNLPLPTQILLFHYLTNKSEVLETGKLISFKELPGGSIYIQPFMNRAVNPLVRAFGNEPEALLEAAVRIGGQANEHGDVGVTVRVFPRLPVTLTLWRADDEFPASGNILFDSSAPAILPTEDYAVLAGTLVAKLKALKA